MPCTQGPWHMGESLAPLHGETVPAVIGDGDSVVALMPGNWNFCTFKAADARLIAAAPDLLDALKKMVEAFGGWGTTDGPTIALATAALSKAQS